MQLNEVKFLENVQKIHLKPGELPIYAAITDADVRVKLNEFIKYGRNPRFSVVNPRFSVVNPRFSVVNMRFSAALDEICATLAELCLKCS
jgi:hypothetical protein